MTTKEKSSTSKRPKYVTVLDSNNPRHVTVPERSIKYMIDVDYRPFRTLYDYIHQFTINNLISGELTPIERSVVDSMNACTESLLLMGKRLTAYHQYLDEVQIVRENARVDEEKKRGKGK